MNRKYMDSRHDDPRGVNSWTVAMTTLEASTAVADISASIDHMTASAAPAAPFPWDTAKPCPDRLETGSYSIGDYIGLNGILAKLFFLQISQSLYVANWQWALLNGNSIYIRPQ